MSEILDAWYSRPLDRHHWSDHPEVKRLTEKVWGEAGLDGLVKASGPKPKQPYVEQLKVVLVADRGKSAIAPQSEAPVSFVGLVNVHSVSI